MDTLGLLLGVRVTPADTTERDGARELLARVLGWFTWLRLLWVDGGYSGPEFARWVKHYRPKLEVSVVQRLEGQRGFAVLGAPLGRGTNLRLAHETTAAGSRLRNHRRQRGSLDSYRDDTNHAPPFGLIPRMS